MGLSPIFYINCLLLLFLDFILLGGIAQFGRASDLHSEGPRFESVYLHKVEILIMVETQIKNCKKHGETEHIKDCSGR